VSIGAEGRASFGGSQAEQSTTRLDPVMVADPAADPGTGLLLFPQADALPSAWVTSKPAGLAIVIVIEAI
jgi:hypothetical protein